MPQFLPVIKLQPFFLLTTSEIPNVRNIRIKKALVVTIFKVHSHLESLAYYCWFYRRLTLGFYHLFYTKDSIPTLKAFIYEYDIRSYKVIQLRDSIYGKQINKPIKLVLREGTGLIMNSLYETMANSGLNDQLTYYLSDVYAWNIDFYSLYIIYGCPFYLSLHAFRKRDHHRKFRLRSRAMYTTGLSEPCPPSPGF